MTGTLGNLAMAVAVFVGGHFLLSSRSVRGPLAERLGGAPFMALYSIVAALSLVWSVRAYGAAPFLEVWVPDPRLNWLPIVLMPVALFLIVASVTTRTPTAVAGERLAQDPKPVAGIMTVTRHPMLCGTALWSLTHLAANGDAASIVLMGGILILSIGGMLHIDHRRRLAMGANWGPIALSTSIVPFLAALQGRTKVDWAGIGLWRVVVALALYAALLYGHAWVAGVPVLTV